MKKKAGFKKQAGFFKSVKPLPGHKLAVEMMTDAYILFDFTSRLHTVLFQGLNDEKVFNSVRTDGNFIIFEKEGSSPISIDPQSFMDLVLVDRTGDVPYY